MTYSCILVDTLILKAVILIRLHRRKTLRRSFSYNDSGITSNQNAGLEKPI